MNANDFLFIRNIRRLVVDKQVELCDPTDSDLYDLCRTIGQEIRTFLTNDQRKNK